MSRIIRTFSLCLLALGLSGTVFAVSPMIAPEVPPLPPPQLVIRSAVIGSMSQPQSQSAAKLFSRPVLLHGTLGPRKIQMRLQPHAEFEGSVQGDYFESGQTQKIALAGEYQGNSLTMEESINGANVCGQWTGSLSGNTYSGTWYGEDESNSVPFALTMSEPAR
ncbi:MAG: hypothetical protein ABI575_05385 [Oxalobacteraceae bacterium]